MGVDGDYYYLWVMLMYKKCTHFIHKISVNQILYFIFKKNNTKEFVYKVLHTTSITHYLLS
jgi:hypothetical protein